VKINFPQKSAVHKRKIPRKSIVKQTHFFGSHGKILTCQEAMYIHYKVEEYLDRWDVETEIDYHEEEGEYTKEEAAELRAQMNDIADEYRGRLDDDGHWHDVLIDILDSRR